MIALKEQFKNHLKYTFKTKKELLEMRNAWCLIMSIVGVVQVGLLVAGFVATVNEDWIQAVKLTFTAIMIFIPVMILSRSILHINVRLDQRVCTLDILNKVEEVENNVRYFRLREVLDEQNRREKNARKTTKKRTKK